MGYRSHAARGSSHREKGPGFKEDGIAQNIPVHEDSSTALPEELAAFNQRVQRLRVSIRYLLVDFWDESRRQRALDLVQSLRAVESMRAKGVSRIVQSLTALLSLSSRDAGAIRGLLEEKCFELLDLLQDQPR